MKKALVVLPTYNEAGTIKKLIEDILLQNQKVIPALNFIHVSTVFDVDTDSLCCGIQWQQDQNTISG